MNQSIDQAALYDVLKRAEVNFSSEDNLDVELLDKVMEIMTNCQGDVLNKANHLLVNLQTNPGTWGKVDAILEYSRSLQTKFFGLQVLEATIKTRWRALPLAQRDGVKSYVATLVMNTCKKHDDDSLTLSQKLNIVLVEIVKQDWPRNWPSFVPDLIASAETDPNVCVNCMKILGLLSEDVFDFGCQNLTQAKENYLKENFCGQFQDVFNFCLRLLKECPADDIVKANLKTIRRFMTWIPVTFIYDTDVLPLLTERFLPLDAYRLPSLQCLTEVAGIVNLSDAYKQKLRTAFFTSIKNLSEYIGPSCDMAAAYSNGDEETQRFVTALSDYLCAFLKNHTELVEVLKDNGTMEMQLHSYALELLLSLSKVDDVEIFKVCLEFWLQLTSDLYRQDPFGPKTYFPGVNLPVHIGGHPRRELYKNHLSNLRMIIINRMAKPEEVLVVENEQGEIVREMVKDTDSITLYKTMKETLVFLTHLDAKDTEAKMTEKLAGQVSGGEFNWKTLSTLCWAVGSISMIMPEEDEKRFLVLVIRDLLGLCEHLALAIFCLAIFSAQAAQYAVLVAGSNGYWNYRHQSDIFHAYQLLKANGIPEENIITMAYDDIANDKQNPFPGQVFNKPSLLKPGKDVYGGVKIDYKGADVTPANFLAVLKGDSAATKGKKVLQSTKDDNVFIYFSDHGAAGLIAFPSEYLYANDFIAALKYMSDNKKYSEMVIYIEACESGSMFDNLLADNIKIYATTAANGEESSWATYCSPNDRINTKSIGSCLGDLYSVNFLENLESVDPTKETLKEQFDIILKTTTKSHVQQYGDLTMTEEVIGNFQGNQTQTVSEDSTGKYSSLVDSRMIKLHYLQNKHSNLGSEESFSALAGELESIERFDNHFERFASNFNLDVSEPLGHIDFTCLKTRVAMYEEVCGKFSDYGLKYVRYLHFSCIQGVDIYDFEETLMKTCA